ncbi:hypothetical protein CC85DRAFT_262417 [Cutaneotrichosporon oleaginosum]|uniref:RING-type domain-containing protein n=1 Tax=Cutaneotrichosporon oleaginosum TaxID=879819 RepID=A0A0J1B0K8_9TREE|nr:uncharacterized protein CC85DRAFT_262417 [Cutaneotrichosporon oleaginosum]KLT41144.1 hypothetical protein CC85DRAFT_262417 [Cutaneotrichosporon oleaginosum]TXT14138.1 hypothetical protein COLE_00331 [Cutaneotrichosporon oleaginosum]
MPLGLIGRWGGAAVAHGKRLIHTVVFSMPSNETGNGTYAALANATNVTVPVAPIGKPQTMPQLSFAGSGYDVTVIIMAILLNRIHNIAHRERRPPPPPPDSPGWRAALRRRVRTALTSPAAPAWLRIPGILVLLRAWALFTVVLMQTAHVWPRNAGDAVERLDSYLGLSRHATAYPLRGGLTYFAGVIDRLGGWGAGMPMPEVCWTVFVSVCFGLTMGALSTGLDVARRRDVGVGFNLFGIAYVLHLYASPLTHVRNPQASPHSRPDVHPLFQLWIGLTELTWLQINELSPRLRRNQLVPTGVCGSLGLAAFTHSLWTQQLRFPSFTFLTHLLALVLSIIIGCTLAVRAITLLFTQGHIPSPVLQSLLPHEGALPSTEDDISIALLKLGVACIESTQFSGLRNELAPIKETQPQVRINGDGVEMVGVKVGNGGFGTRIDKIEAMELTDPNAESPYLVHITRLGAACVFLARNILWTTILSTWVGRDIYRLVWRAYQARWWYGPRQWTFWRSEAWEAPPRRYGGEPPLLLAWALAQRRKLALERMRGIRIAPPPEPTIAEATDESWTYDQVLRGEVEVEDDDDDWRSEHSDASGESDLEDEEDEAALYRDLMRAKSPDEDGEAIQPILLAHLTSTSTSPLTRRRYAEIRSGPASAPSTPTRALTTATAPSLDPLSSAIAARQEDMRGVQRDEWDEERRRSCVVCMVQTRDVILWPCRCLLMCSDCRESLAARLPAKDQACPSCRTKVEGYSRIYVP